jgi:hypothetical protein
MRPQDSVILWIIVGLMAAILILVFTKGVVGNLVPISVNVNP